MRIERTEQTESRIRDVLAELCKGEISSLALDDDLVEKLGMDSLQGLQVLAVLEKRFGLRFRDEELADLRTIRKLLAAIQASSPRRTS